MNGNINANIQQIMALKNKGMTPQAVTEMLMQRNPNYQMAMQRLKNMSQGRDMKQFVLQLARQNGVTQENLQALSQLFGNNN